MESEALGLIVYGCTDVGRVKDHNEDAFVVADLMDSRPMHTMPGPIELRVGERGVLLAVSDGMGGARAGEVASALTLHALRRELSSVEASNVEAALMASVERANTEVCSVAEDAQHREMGATLTAVLVHGGRAYVAEIGDSRAYLLREGSVVRLTHDQSCAQRMVEAHALTREQVETFAYKRVVMQAIGTKPNVVVAQNRLSLRPDDRLLLCSDGLTGKVSDEELQSILMASPVDVVCAKLVELANARGGEDNVTVVVAAVHCVVRVARADDEETSIGALKDSTERRSRTRGRTMGGRTSSRGMSDAKFDIDQTNVRRIEIGRRRTFTVESKVLARNNP